MEKKEQSRERMRKMRERNKNIEDSVTQSHENVTQSPTSVTESPDVVTQDVTQRLFWYKDNKRIELKSVPEGCKVLSDGQVWRPWE